MDWHILILLTPEGEIVEEIKIQESLSRDLNPTTRPYSIQAIGMIEQNTGCREQNHQYSDSDAGITV